MVLKKRAIIANSMLSKAALANYILDAICCAIGIVLAKQTAYIWLICLGVLTIAYACTTDRWCLCIEFYREGLLYKPLFRKGKMIDYAHYPRIQYAYYMHGNLFAAYRVHFFVFTNRRLSNDELAHINAVAPSEDLIKIRYTRRNYEKLLAALPESIAARVRRIYETYIRKERAK